MNSRTSLLLLIALLAAPAVAQVDCTKTTSCGATVQDVLDFASGACLDNETRRYTLFQFPASNGQTIAVHVESPVFPPAVQLIDPALKMVAADENAGQTSAANASTTASVTGTWMVRVRNINVGDGGPYSLTVSCVIGPPPAPEPGPTFGFRLTANPGSLTMCRDQSASVLLRSFVDTNTSQLELSASAPNGFSVTLDPSTIPAPGYGQSQVTIRTGSQAPSGMSVITLTGRAADGTTRSAAVTATVQFVCSPPRILRQTPDQHIEAQHSATLVAEPEGSQPIALQWYKGPRGSRFFTLAGKTSPVLVTDILPRATEYQFWFEARNECGSIESRTISVFASPHVRHRGVRK